MQADLPQSELIIPIMIGIVLMLVLAFAFVLFYYFSQQKFQTQQVQAQERELLHQQQLLFHSIQVQEQERARVARELHDEIGSKLNVLNLGLHQLHKSMDETVIQEMFSMVNTTLSASRRIAHDLLPPALANFGLATALQELGSQVQQSTDINIRLQLSPAPSVQNEDQMTSLQFFRVVQELLSNTIKYAQATEIELKLLQTSQSTTLSYQDDGQGFDLHSVKQKQGMGLNNIKVRMQMIDATYTLASKSGEGVHFQATKSFL